MKRSFVKLAASPVLATVAILPTSSAAEAVVRDPGCANDSYNANAATGYGPSFYDRHNHGIPYLHQIRHPYGGSWEDKISAFDEAS